MTLNEIYEIKNKISKGVWDTALDRNDFASDQGSSRLVPAFPNDGFIGFCLIRLKQDFTQSQCYMAIYNNKPICINQGPVHYAEWREVSLQQKYNIPAECVDAVNDLWGFISGIERQKRQKNKPQSR